MAILYITHNLGVVARVCDRVAVLDKGSLRFVGPIREITTAGFGKLLSAAAEQDLSLELAGEVAVIRAALGGAEVVSWQALEAGAVRVVLKSQSQADVDGCLDRLRKHNVSITGLWRVRRSLEDAFLAIVAETVEE